MGNIKLNRWIAIIGSALFCSLGLYINVALCSFFVLVPFFLTTKATTVKSSFVNGFCIGAAVAIVMLHGMYGVLINYTQGNAIMALLGIAVVMVLLGFVFGALSLGQFFFSKNKNILINILSFTGFSVLLEWTCTKLFLGFPWIVYHPGQMLLDNNYTIQIGAYGGILMLSLWVIVVNYSIATIFRVQRWKLLPYPIAVIIIGFGCGYIAYQQAQKINMNSKPISVAILAENSSPDEKWDAAFARHESKSSGIKAKHTFVV
jgi:apolipoprotein N-acyltransferase